MKGAVCISSILALLAFGEAGDTTTAAPGTTTTTGTTTTYVPDEKDMDTPLPSPGDPETNPDSQLPHFFGYEMPDAPEGRPGRFQWEEYVRYSSEEAPLPPPERYGEWKWFEYEEVVDKSKCPAYEWCTTPYKKHGMCLDGLCQDVCIKGLGGCNTLLKDEILPCALDFSRRDGMKCFLDDEYCKGKSQDDPCRSFDGGNGTCQHALQPPAGEKKLELKMHGQKESGSLDKGPLVCKLCGQFGERATSPDDCCTGAVLGGDAENGAVGACKGCNKDSECPSNAPICDDLSQQCKCSKDSCWEGFRCFNARGVEVQPNEAGRNCACNVVNGEPVNCKASEVCQQGRCIKGDGKGKGKGNDDGKGKGKGNDDGKGKGKGNDDGKGKGKGNDDGKGKGKGNDDGKGKGKGKGPAPPPMQPVIDPDELWPTPAPVGPAPIQPVGR